MKKSTIVMSIVVIATAVFCYSLGKSLGKGQERLRNYDQYIWRFSQYSACIRDLAERQQIVELTNTVIIFDTRFNARQNAHDLEDVVLQILRLGKYYVDTNAATSAQTNKK